MNYDQTIEKHYHPENFEEDTLEGAGDLIDALEDAVSDLSYFSVRHGDIFNGQVYELEEVVKQCRLQL